MYRPQVSNLDNRLIAEEFERQKSIFEMQILHAAPSRTTAGMIVYADGTDWNPGAGQGVYRRNVANAAWVFLG